jgi:hypothetical protein
MREEDKDLLLKDICTRLPYRVRCNYYDCCEGDYDNGTICGFERREYIQIDGVCIHIEEVKPYLLPISSMTEEQKKEYNFWKHEVPVCHYEYGDVVEEVELLDSPESFEYLIENHFDYRGLIEKGLAIDATNKNIY